MRILVAAVLAGSTLLGTAIAGPLGDAVRSGDSDEVRRLLDADVDANAPDGPGTALHWAALNGHVEIIGILASHGADLDAQSNMLGTPLHAAVRRGNTAAVNALLDSGANPDSRDRNEFTPIMVATLEGRLDAVRALIEAGADVNAVGIGPGGVELGEGPTTALHLARAKNQRDIAESLVEAGAGPTFPRTPFDSLSTGDAAKGREIARTYCEQCHRIAASDTPHLGTYTAGPSLVGVIGRPVAGVPEYEYSEALRNFGGNWSPERLYAFVLQPMLVVPGTRMVFSRDRTPEMIADLVAYFESAAK